MKCLVPIASLLLALAACGDDGAVATTSIAVTTTAATTTTTAVVATSIAATSTTVADDTVVIRVDDIGGWRVFEDEEERSLGDRIDVDLGDTVRLLVTLAQGGEIHVHTYDLDVDAAPGVEATLEFVVDIPGIFEIELHEGHVLLFELEVS